MKRGLLLSFSILAVQWLSTSPVSATTFDEARHLLSRTSFGGNSDEIQALTQKEYSEAVSQMLDDVHTTSTVPPPEWVKDRPLLYMNFKQGILEATKSSISCWSSSVQPYISPKNSGQTESMEDLGK